MQLRLLRIEVSNCCSKVVYLKHADDSIALSKRYGTPQCGQPRARDGVSAEYGMVTHPMYRSDWADKASL